MESLGFSTDALKPEWDMSDSEFLPSADTAVNRVCASRPAVQDFDPEAGMECSTPVLDVLPGESKEDRLRRCESEVKYILASKVEEARNHGLGQDEVERLENMLSWFVNVFRKDIGCDPPIKVEPLLIRLKPDAVPVKCSMRRYPPDHVEFLKRHVDQLEAAGLVYRNNRATWAAAPRIVPKKDPGDLRMTIDSRPINICTVPMPWPIPNLDAAMVVLVGTSVYLTLDWTKGYWQLPLHPASQELYSIIPPCGAFTPTRVLMGQSDAIAFCQSDGHQMFEDLLFRGLLAWLDDLLGAAITPMGLFDLISKRLVCLGQFALAYFILSAGVTHSPARREKSVLAKILVSAMGWAAEHTMCFEAVKKALTSIVPLSPPREDMALPLCEQRHEPLAFLNGSFVSASSRWPIVEKEVFAVVEALARLDYLWIRSGGFRLFTDHSNLVYIFYPRGQSPIMAKYQTDKLQCWALVMSTFPYTIESVSGEDNVWGATPAVARVRLLAALVSPLRHKDFEWPTAQSVLKSQKNGLQDDGQPPPGVTWDDDIKFYVTPGDKIWVPDDDLDLQQRLCVIAHQGLKHVLVVKDDISGFVRLFPSRNADSTAMAAALMDWFTLLSEWRLPATQWPMVLPLVQGALNHQPSNRLGGLAPVTAFGGFDATQPLSGTVLPTTKEVRDVDWLDKSRIKQVQDLRTSLDEMHRDVLARSEKLCGQARARHAKKQGVKWTNFDVGDYVLVGSVVRHPSKLAMTWRGPSRITRVITDYVMAVEQLVPPFNESVHHVCRLKLYSEAANGTAEDQLEQAAYGEGGFYVEDLRACQPPLKLEAWVH
ncbi:hypothetical protein H310_03902 [Aphanomyces invadans]|uniref:Reverse transcriptase RNase H-like domain-containing protein n=1 Tax=Aphanomyces invadans TaxID=157072 RepID=A0A024UEW0_9STRA|nr:hypothetical protein H310_03902 [Aphanomyces invadans]ETW04755.1 hypothetical protein H310_03902 [Aphanomyces invadans]|eukprot:XP_008866193.1 hypothetical protein H310_03902 [Aphanomyces invadans]